MDFFSLIYFSSFSNLFVGIFFHYPNAVSPDSQMKVVTKIVLASNDYLKRQKIRAAGIEPATLRLLRSSHYSLTLYQLS